MQQCQCTPVQSLILFTFWGVTVNNDLCFRFVAEEEDAAVPVYTCTVGDIVYILGVTVIDDLCFRFFG
jgi:hypothetical protein